MIVLFVLFLGIAVVLLYKMGVWTFQKKNRTFTVLLMIGVLIPVFIYVQRGNPHMHFIQSNVYPQLYLVKNRVVDNKLTHRTIKEKVLEVMNEQGMDENTTMDEAKQFKVQFYEYTKGDWGARGTAYFIDHEERSDGMLSELLEFYPGYLVAKTKIHPCTNNSAHYRIELHYYEARQHIKTDTLINTCGK